MAAAAPRAQWDKKIEFLLTCISTSVGLGNVWRFPMKAYQYGGGAFLIPYLILLFIIGRPLYFLEMVLGQFGSGGAIKTWNAVPAFKGVGYAQMVTLSYVAIFYNYLLAISFLYTFLSMQPTLPWACPSPVNETLNDTIAEISDSNISSSCAEEFWRVNVLDRSPNLDVITKIQWPIFGCLALAWTLVFISVAKGIKSMGKVSYVTSVFPYISLLALLIITLLKDGAIEGIIYFIKPEWNKLLDIKVWYEAVVQSFFSLNVGYGNIITLSSYNTFRHNIQRDALIISLMDTFTSILAGAVVFSALGVLAHQKNISIPNVAKADDMGLAFIVYPEALSNISFLPQLWSVLFFLMLVSLALGSSISQIETILTTLKDQFPRLQKRKTLLALGVCFFFFVCGIPLTTNGGQHIMKVLDDYGVGKSVFLYSIITVLSVVWIYGIRSLFQDIHFMMQEPLNIFWKLTWALFTPLTLVAIFAYGLYFDYNHVPDPNEKSLPLWGHIFGWILFILALNQIPVWYLIQVVRTQAKSIVEKLKAPLKSSPEWGPADAVLRQQWQEFKSQQDWKHAEEKHDVIVLKNFNYITSQDVPSSINPSVP